MSSPTLLRGVVIIIAISTVITGLIQVFNPGFVLRIVSAEQTETTKHFFAIVGMFMALFGGMMLHALARAGSEGVVWIWSGLQKLGASAAVGLGVAHHVFAPLALAIAGFDLLSGIAIFVYRSLIHKRAEI